MTTTADILPPTLIALMKGVVERDAAPETWQGLLQRTSQVRDHVSVIGLELLLDEVEGYAYLRQKPDIESGTPLPRLVPRRQLSYPVSLMLALLRRRLAEADAASGDTRLVLARSDIHDLMRHFLKDGSNEAKQSDRLDQIIKKVVDLGFLRSVKGDADAFEVRRILAAFVNAQWLTAFDEKLAAYAVHVDASREGTDVS
jgi:Domain of unknown function (DUF4194)